MNKIGLVIILLLTSVQLVGQRLNNTWLLGNDSGWPNLGRIVFDSSSYTLQTEQRKMSFKGTQATISDQQGNFLMSSNGVWIANANNDTMLNGNDINPSYLVNSFPNGIPLENGNLFLPFPGDSNKYVLFHKTSWGQFAISLKAIYKSVIDITLDGGLGGVIEKNDTLLSDTLSWGIAACKHGNGRDWWIVAITDGNPIIYKFLLTPNGVESVSTQILNFFPNTYGNVSQIIFSPDGSKFLYSSPINQTQSGFALLLEFNRCSGTFFNEQIIPISSGSYLWGMDFSSSSNYSYLCTSQHMFQINNLNLIVDTVATYDGFVSGFPPLCCDTDFDVMYLAANGKIYITSGSSVQHIHEMNYPDSAGLASNVQQHAINIGTTYFHLRAVPNHPNYNLGPVIGSPCDTLGLGIEEKDHLINISISPIPNAGNFRISYALVHNKKGTLEIVDLNGVIVYSQILPPWSTVQSINLPTSISSGMYSCRISSGFTK